MCAEAGEVFLAGLWWCGWEDCCGCVLREDCCGPPYGGGLWDDDDFAVCEVELLDEFGELEGVLPKSPGTDAVPAAPAAPLDEWADSCEYCACSKWGSSCDGMLLSGGASFGGRALSEFLSCCTNSSQAWWSWKCGEVWPGVGVSLGVWVAAIGRNNKPCMR